jgi:hypothetical protein
MSFGLLLHQFLGPGDAHKDVMKTGMSNLELLDASARHQGRENLLPISAG